MTDPAATETERKTITVSLNGPLSTVMQEVERLYLSHAMTLAQGNKTKAAEISGMSRDTFNKKVERYTVQAVYTLA